MKTTIDLPDSLLEEAKREAVRRETTVKALVEAGLRKELRAGRSDNTFRLRDSSFRGKGLRPDVAALPWEQLRELAYDPRRR